MRLALVTNNRFPPREGVARHLLETGRRLAACGHEVRILARAAGLKPRERMMAGLHLVEHPGLPLAPLRYLSDYAVPSHPFTAALTTRSLEAARARLRSGEGPRRGPRHPLPSP